MLLLKHGSMWLVIFLLLGVRNSDSAELPKGKQQKSAAEEVRDSGGGTTVGLLQYQADSGGYRNNSDPAPEHPVQDKEPEDTPAPVTEGINFPTTVVDIPDPTNNDQAPVESSTHQEEMTFGEEFENEERIIQTTEHEEENTERSADRELASGSTVYEVVAEQSGNREELNSSPQSDFPHDIGTGESNHEGYNEDAILYFESKRFKGLKKKNQGNNKFRETSNSIAEPVTSNKERVHITSYVADITEVDGKDEITDPKDGSKPPPRDATTISTFFIAPRETVSRRTPVRIRKKIIKPVRLGYRKKQTPSFSSDSQPTFRQKVALVEPPSSRVNKENREKEKSETVIPSTTTEKFNVFHEDVIDNIDVPLDEKNYLPLSPISLQLDSGPYIPPPTLPPPQSIPLPIAHIVQRVPEQYLREEVTKYQIKDELSAVLPTIVPEVTPHEYIDSTNQGETERAPISFIDVLSHNEYRPIDKHVSFVTSKSQKELKGFGNQKLGDYDSLTNEYDIGLTGENKDQTEKSNFEETNRAEDGLTSSDTILAPIQAAVSLSNHVQQEGKKKPVTNTLIEQQEIRVEPVIKTTIEIQKSIPFEIKEIRPEYNSIPNFNAEYEKQSESASRPIPQQNDFLQQVALAYHKLSNNGDYQTNLQVPSITTHQPQPQNYVYFYRNRLPQQPLYLFPVYNKGANDFSKGHVGPYIMQQSYKNLGYEHHSRPTQYQNLKYQGLYPSLTRPLAYSNFYDFATPLLYQSNIPVVGHGYHKSQVQIRVPSTLEQNPTQHLGSIRTTIEESNGANNEEEIEPPSTEESIDTTEEIKQGSEIQIQEAKQEILQEPPTESPYHHEGHTSPPLIHQTYTQPPQQHVTEPQRIPNNQPYPYGYSFVYPISTTDFRSQYPYLNYHRRGKTPPFRPSHPMYTSQYPPHTYLVASNLPERGIHARSINHKKLCIEYGGFKPPLVPSIQIDEEFEKEAQDKSSKDE